jgi:hypothetical protein
MVHEHLNLVQRESLSECMLGVPIAGLSSFLYIQDGSKQEGSIKQKLPGGLDDSD